MSYQLIIIGGGPAGLAAAYSAWDAGLRRILLLERDKQPGGTLLQWAELSPENTPSGPDCISTLLQRLEKTSVEIFCSTTVLEITAARVVKLVSAATGYQEISADRIILATGCREETRAVSAIPGYRPAGVLTAGAAQYYINVLKYLPGEQFVILGTDPIGRSLARSLPQWGANIVAKIDSASKTITEIRGHERVTGITVMELDENGHLCEGTQADIVCDTVLLATGFIPNQELLSSLSSTEIPSVGGILLCGNVRKIHDSLSAVITDGEEAGREAAEGIKKDFADSTLLQ